MISRHVVPANGQQREIENNNKTPSKLPYAFSDRGDFREARRKRLEIISGKRKSNSGKLGRSVLDSKMIGTSTAKYGHGSSDHVGKAELGAALSMSEVCQSTTESVNQPISEVADKEKLCFSSKKSSSAAAFKKINLILETKRTGKLLGVTHCEELCISSKNALSAAARKKRKLILVAKRTGKPLGVTDCAVELDAALIMSEMCQSTAESVEQPISEVVGKEELCISFKNASSAAACKKRKLILETKRTGNPLGVAHCEEELVISSKKALFAAARKKRKFILVAKRTGKPLGVTHCEASSQRECFRTARKKRMDIILSKRTNKESRTDNAGEFSSIWDIGGPSYSCLKCGAQMWFQERGCKNSGMRNPIFRLCCSDGRVILPMLRPAPTFLDQLLTNKEDIRSKDFRKRIRTYNSLFAFTSMGGKVDYSVNKGGYGPYVFRLNGQNHHHIGSLLPAEGDSPRFAQLYFFDTENELKNRIEAVIKDTQESTIDNAVVCGILEMLDNHNPLVKTFRMARDRFKEVGVDNVTIQLISERSTKNGLYNGPTCSEVAAVIVGDFGIESNGRDILIEYTKSGVQRIFEDHPSFMALQYPLLFPYGEDGFMHGIKYNNTEGVAGIKRKCVTIREYYAFRLQRRKIEGKTLFLAGRLFQQYIVDAYSCIEDTRLRWVRMNQGNLRSEIYRGLKDAVFEGDCDASKVGQRVILPATFTGGKRYMVQNYQDAMAICRWAGYPDLFLTFTCNPKWAEIVHGIEYSTSIASEDGPDLIARVFKIKLNSLMDDLIARKHFGKVKAAVYTIEFQKRGLPHAHILLFLDPVDKIQTVEHIDRFITAEIPDPVADSIAYNIVRECMVHGPCGDGYSYNKCRVKGQCSKKFPKKYQNRTSINEDGFPMYRRRDTGVTITKAKAVVTNRYIVPYNRDLIVKYNAHINIEWCNRYLSIKYLFKYINKGSDRATVVLKKKREEININGAGKEIDETKAYLDCRYISAAEACWRIFNFDIHYRKPGVERLNFHLLDGHSVTFSENARLDKVLTRPGVQDTMFTEWMKTNAANEEARQLTYVDFPTKWVWYGSDKTWRKRKNGMCIGRIYHAHPSSGERYYLRMLLNVVKGPRNFEEIRTVGNVIYKTYKEACNAHGLLENDREWNECLVEASVWATSYQLRELFVTILNNCQPAKPEQIWDSNWKLLADDILHKQRLIMHCGTLSLSENQMKAYVLCELETLLQRLGKTLADFPKMPLVDKRLAFQQGNKLIQEELAYDKDMQMSEHEELFKGMNPEQFVAYKAVVDAVENSSGGLFFIYGHGGTGKTYLYRSILSLIRARGEVALSVASSGIASLLLPGGRTAHSRFRIPLDIHEDSICDIKPGSSVAELILQTSIILWDEAPMAHKNCFEALDRALGDLMQVTNSSTNSKPFGGKVVVLGGDFRQILPVVKKGTRADIVNAAINKSYLWKECQVFKLHQNMRLFQKDLDIQQKQVSYMGMRSFTGVLILFVLQPQMLQNLMELICHLNI